MKRPAEIDPKKSDAKMIDVRLKEKTKHGLLDYATILATVLMEMPLRRPIFGSTIPDGLIKRIKKTMREAEKIGVSLGQMDQSLRSAISEGRPRGHPVDKKYATVCLWASLAKRDEGIPWSMLVRLLSWFKERLKDKKYGEEIYLKQSLKPKDIKELKKRCLPKIDQNIEIIVMYLKLCFFSCPQRKYFPRSVKFSKNSIEVEVDFIDGGEPKTLRMKRNFITQKYTEVFLNISEGRDFGSVIFTEYYRIARTKKI
jgi:hypothetical protein